MARFEVLYHIGAEYRVDNPRVNAEELRLDHYGYSLYGKEGDLVAAFTYGSVLGVLKEG